MDKSRQPTAEELRGAAQYVEEGAASLPDLVAPAQDRAGAFGLATLGEWSGQTAAALYALAEASKAGLDVSPVLLVPLQPYLDAFRLAQGAAGTKESKGVAKKQ
jgi:hypothetical protein